MREVSFDDLDSEIQENINDAQEAASRRFPPDEDDAIGAVLVADSKKFIGANIRRRATNESTCAERMVLDKALFNGAKKIKRLVVSGFNEEQPYEDIISPCGECRQIYSEALEYLKQEDFKIVLSNQDRSKVVITSLSELLPLSYKSSER